MKLGAHMSTRGGVWTALERGTQAGCDAVQLFVKNNMQWFAKPFTQVDLKRFALEQKRSRLAAVFAHSGYLINLGAPAGPNRDHSIKSLIQELELTASLGISFLVLHPGAHLGKGEPAGLKAVVAGLNEVFRATRSLGVRIALENTAGQGTCLGYRMSHLATIYDRVNRPERLGLCIDTAHCFAAGYDIRTPKGWESAMAEIDAQIGLDQVLAFHLNDSKTQLGSRVDRHQHIGQGHIGRQGFRHIVTDRRFKERPACLETPKSDDLHEDVQNLAVLRGLVGSRPSTAGARASTRAGRRKGTTPPARPSAVPMARRRNDCSECPERA